MIRTGEEYRAGLRDGREIWIDGERFADVTEHPAFRPIVAAKARMYDMAHETASAALMSFAEGSEAFSILLRPPTEQEHWHEKWRAVDAYLNDIKGVVTRVGDETVGEMWSLFDGRDVLNQIDPRFGDNIERHIRRVLEADIFHVSANTDPKGDRSKRPQDQDPDMMVHVVKETDAGLVLRGAKYETAASYADQAFLKPTIGAWSEGAAVGLRRRLHREDGSAGGEAFVPRGICRAWRPRRLPAREPLRRGRYLARPRRCADPLGGRVLLSSHPRRLLYPRHPAPLFRVSLRAAYSLHGRHEDRRGVVERAADRPRQIAGGARKTRRPRLLPRGDQCPSDCRDCPSAA